MALISASTIITSISLFHLTLGFFFLTNPGTIADQALVYVVGESMGMPYARSFETRSPPLAFLAVVLAFIGITDLITLSYPEEVGLVYHWSTQAPLRFLLSIVLLLYTFLFGPASPLYGSASRGGRFTHPSTHARNPGYLPSGWGGDGLKNRVFFTFMFVEMITWFWIWVTLREERHQLAVKKARRRSHSHGH